MNHIVFHTAIDVFYHALRKSMSYRLRVMAWSSCVKYPVLAKLN